VLLLMEHATQLLPGAPVLAVHVAPKALE